MSRKRVPLNQNECTADFRIGVPFEQNLQEKLHRSVMGDNQEKKLVMLKGGHYLHFEQKERIVSFVNGFVE